MDRSHELKTKRLVLRPFKRRDAADVLEYANDPEWGRYQVNVPHPFTMEDAEEFVSRFSVPSAWDAQPMFAVLMEAKVVGQVYLHTDQSDVKNERAELGYMLARSLWGKGLATEAAGKAVDWGFNIRGLHRIHAYCDPRNVASWRVMEKLGMQREGIFRQHLKWNGEYRDALYYGILRSEWHSTWRCVSNGRPV